jgi:hypothetical protein
MDHLEWRGIKTVCTRCGGTGSYWYGSTSTWRGGMAGAAMTRGVCDVCWGSGDAERHWTDLRKLRDEQDERIAAGAAELLARAVGLKFKLLRPGLRELIGELEKFGRSRKGRADGFDTACRALANVLTEMLNATEKE